jgi:hypothetical protein
MLLKGKRHDFVDRLHLHQDFQAAIPLLSSSVGSIDRALAGRPDKANNPVIAENQHEMEIP